MSRPRFRLAETTADTGLIAWGADAPELFENAAAGLTSLVADPRSIRPREVRRVAAAGGDLPGLLVAWLSEWVYLFDAEGFLGREFSVEELSAGRVAGSARGETRDPARHRLRSLVKGITYHRLAVAETAGGRLRARVIIDL
jgi:SHS2 domain-containing protein